MIKLFESKDNCCGCAACMNVCSKQAITMQTDKYGFLYPHIETDKCVECGVCVKICAYQKDSALQSPRQVYAAASKNGQLLKKSASGAVFSTIAKYVIEHGGVVFGTAMFQEGDNFVVRHISVDSLENLPLLLGSKYVQSYIGNTYKEVKALLLKGTKVLFSGTPCQCAGLRSFLRKGYENLFVIDIICHGVPSLSFFNDYINFNFKSLSGIRNFKFRDKTRGWEMTARLDYENSSKLIPGRTSSYFTLFLDGHIYRENCYSCKYARQERVGDLTIGDFWGIQREHPELLKNNVYSTRKGISCILVNTDNGELLFKDTSSLFNLAKSSFEKVARRNEQLSRPSAISKLRPVVLKIYREKGYEGVEKFYRRTYKKQILVHQIFNMMPRFIKEFVRKRK